MLNRTVKPSNCEINFQSGFVCLWVVLVLKMAYRLREGLLGGISDRKVADFTYMVAPICQVLTL
jgi:hypothetical protein